MLPTTLLADPVLIAPRTRVLPPRPIRLRIRPGRLLLVALAALVIGGLLYVRVWPPLATVMSGSMEPTIGTGDMVVLKRLSGPPHIGQIVAIPVPDSARTRYGYPPVVVHRVLKISRDGQITSKGDAFPKPDPFTTPVSTVRTHVIARIPDGGHVFAFFSSGLGLLWLAAGVVLLIGLPLLERSRDGRQAEDASLSAQLRAISEELKELRLERDDFEDRYEALSRDESAAQEQLRLMARQLAELPAQIERAIAGAVVHAPPAPEPPEEPVDVLAELELALFAAPATDAPRIDESGPQLAFLLDVERSPRFARPSEDQLAFGLETAGVAAGQLALAPPPPPPDPPAPPPPPPPPPRWDAPPPGLVRARRRSGGLVGHTRIALSVGVERFRAVAQAAATS